MDACECQAEVTELKLQRNELRRLNTFYEAEVARYKSLAENTEAELASTIKHGNELKGKLREAQDELDTLKGKESEDEFKMHQESRDREIYRGASDH